MVLVTVLPPFHYAPLDLASDGIRLLRLLRGEPADAIECQILETCLRDTNRTPYEALSYCWGSNKLTSAVMLDGCDKPVTDNLLIALKHLRRHDTDRIIWIDAICINQDNKKEQGHQVAQMKRIYENAGRVVVWLGEGTDDTEILMEVMGDLENHPAKKDSLMKRDSALKEVLRSKYQQLLTDASPAVAHHQPYEKWINQSLSRTLERLFDRPWFRRIWVVQEVACAKSVVFMCGAQHISERPFCDLVSLLGILTNNQARAILDLLPGRWASELWWNKSWWNEKRDLHTLLVKFQNSEATNERDRVYALLGISSDASLGNLFPPDYEKPMEEVAQNTMSFILFGEHVDIDAYPLPRWTLDQVIQGGTGRNPGPLACNVLSWALMNAATSTAERLLKPSARGAPVRSPHEYHRFLVAAVSASTAEDVRLVVALLAFQPVAWNLFDSLMVKCNNHGLRPPHPPASFQLMCSKRMLASYEGLTEVICFPPFEGRDALAIAQAQPQLRQSEGWKKPSRQKLDSFLRALVKSEPYPLNARPDLSQSLIRQGADQRTLIDGPGRYVTRTQEDDLDLDPWSLSSFHSEGRQSW